MSRFGKLEDLTLAALFDATEHLNAQLCDVMGCWYEAVIEDDFDEKRRVEPEILHICAARRDLRLEVVARGVLAGEIS